MRREQRVFTIRTNSDHPVFFWQGYGCVCPSLWTTNGSIPYVAHLLSQWRKHRPDDFQIVDSILPTNTDFADPVAVRAVLTEAWQAFSC